MHAPRRSPRHRCEALHQKILQASQRTCQTGEPFWAAFPPRRSQTTSRIHPSTRHGRRRTPLSKCSTIKDRSEVLCRLPKEPAEYHPTNRLPSWFSSYVKLRRTKLASPCEDYEKKTPTLKRIQKRSMISTAQPSQHSTSMDDEVEREVVSGMAPRPVVLLRPLRVCISVAMTAAIAGGKLS